MATTTNYGWTTPDDTALVKDGASAIRTLGSSVDTTTKNLNPSTTLGDIEYRSSTSNTNTRLGIGTSGQALTVVAGAPSWAASATSVLTTTGDSLYASAANTLARLGIGSTGQVLTVASGLPSWATPSSYNPNYVLLNSGGTSLSGTSTQVSGISSKTDLYIFITGASIAANGYNLTFTFNGDTGANYNMAGVRHNSVDAPLVRPISSYTSQTGGAWNFGPAASQTINAIIRVSGCNSSGLKVFASNASSNSNDDSFNYQGQGHYTGSSTISSVEVRTSGSTFDAGTIYVYGA